MKKNVKGLPLKYQKTKSARQRILMETVEVGVEEAANVETTINTMIPQIKHYNKK